MFTRVKNQQNAVAKRLIALREKKKFRLDERGVVVQGLKTIKELQEQGMKIRSLIMTVDKAEMGEKTPLNSPLSKKISADNYYATDVNLTRRILGTSSRPSNQEVYAEVVIPQHGDFDLTSKDRLLVLDNIKDPGNLGTLVRSAMALKWDSGIIVSGTCDLYNDKTLRASRGLSLSWQQKIISNTSLLGELKRHGFTPIVADMLPPLGHCWSLENYPEPTVGSGLWFSNAEKQELPKKVALVLSSEHSGVNKAILMNEMKVSLPMSPMVESLNVANVGGIIMNELNRYLLSKKHASN